MIWDPIREQVDEIILDWDTTDIVPSKGKFTWTKKRLGPSHIDARLDKFLVHDNFLLLGLNPSSNIFPFGGSDHKPILLELKKDYNLGPIAFPFNPLWTSQTDFLEVVKEAWSVLVSRFSFFV